MHTHVFNGADLQVARFFSEVIALHHDDLKPVGELLGELADFAPSVQREFEALRSVEEAASGRNRGIVPRLARALREERYQVARRELSAA